jgi:hypothetical protein
MDKELKKTRIIQAIEGLLVLAAIGFGLVMYSWYRGQQDDFDSITRDINHSWQHRLDSTQAHHQDLYDDLGNKVEAILKRSNVSKQKIKEYEIFFDDGLSDADRDSLWRAAGFR